MATKRFGYLDDLSLKNQKVGIGTSTANEKLEVLGGTRGGDVVVTGIATLTSYEGFQNKKTSYVDNVNITGGESGTLSGEIVIGSGTTLSVGTGATTGQGSIKSLKVSNTFNPPIGDTSERPSAPKPGALYYNKDFKTIEYWDGNFWRQVDNTTRSGRVVWAGGYDQGGTPSSSTSSIDYIHVPTLGNSMKFGELSAAGQDAHGCGSRTRGLFGGKFNGTQIDYITIASSGNGMDYGDLTASRNYCSGASSSTRGMWMGGKTPTAVNTIDKVEIQTLGNAADFGDLTVARQTYGGAISDGRYILVGGGYGSPSITAVSTYDRKSITSSANAVEFGTLITKFAYSPGGAGNQTRGIWAGGSEQPAKSKNIQYVIMASGGNTQYFGDLSVGGLAHGGGTSIRSVFSLGETSSGDVNTLEYVTIATAGNSTDFGDLRGGANRCHTRVISPLSDSHGGLGGF